MKTLGVLFLIPVALTFAILLLTLALWLTFASTIGNARFFRSEFEQNISQKELENAASILVTSAISSTPEYRSSPIARNLPRLPLDPAWFAVTFKDLLLGSQAYLTGAADALPSISLQPFYKSLENALVMGIVEQDDQAQAAFDTFGAALKKLPGGGLADGEPTEEAIKLLLSGNPLKNLPINRPTAILMLKAMLLPPGSGSEPTLASVIRVAVRSQLNLANAKDSLDLNIFLTNLFGHEQNIVRVARDSGLGLARSVSLTVSLLLGLVVLLIMIVSFSGKTPLWLGIPFVASGLVLLGGPIAFQVYQPELANWVSVQTTIGDGPRIVFMQRLIMSVMQRMSGLALAFSLIMILLGTALIMLAVFWPKIAPANMLKDGPKPSRYRLVRLPAALSILILIGLLIGAFAGKAESTVKSIASADSKPVNQSVVVVFDKTANTGFSNLIR
jgi:hypothetical protein